MEASEFSRTYERRVSEARARFSARLQNDLDSVQDEMPHALATTLWPTLPELHHWLHEVSGSSGMLGLSEVHDISRHALKVVEAAVIEDRGLTDEERKQVGHELSSLRQIVARSEQ